MSDARGLKICGECGSVNVAPVYPGEFECDDCGSSLVVDVDENPRYGPGNPDFDRDFAREQG